MQVIEMAVQQWSQVCVCDRRLAARKKTDLARQPMRACDILEPHFARDDRGGSK